MRIIINLISLMQYDLSSSFSKRFVLYVKYNKILKKIYDSVFQNYENAFGNKSHIAFDLTTCNL